ncbi:MAG: xylose isomerase [Chloroflexota bacterium]
MVQRLFCLNASTIRPVPLLDKIRIAGQAGYGGIELWNNELDAFIAAGGSLTQVRRALDDAGLAVPDLIALHGWIESSPEEYPRVRDEARRRMEQAAALGAPYIIASPPRGRVDLERAAERYGDLLALGREVGVKPSMEFLGFVEHIKTIRTAWYIVERAGDPDGTIVMDSFHIYNGGSTLEDLRAVPGARISMFHINDAPATPPPGTLTDADRVMPGDGVIDLPAMLRVLDEIGYAGPISLELFNQALWEQDPLAVARTGMERLTRLVGAG